MGSAKRWKFDPEELQTLTEAYEGACRDLKGRPQWRWRLGDDVMTRVAARAIVDAASDGITSSDELAFIAVRAVKVRFLRLLH